MADRVMLVGVQVPATFRAKLPDDIQFDFIDGPFKSDAAAGIDIFY
jgi:hypothetical protein